MKRDPKVIYAIWDDYCQSYLPSLNMVTFKTKTAAKSYIRFKGWYNVSVLKLVPKTVT